MTGRRRSGLRLAGAPASIIVAVACGCALRGGGAPPTTLPGPAELELVEVEAVGGSAMADGEVILIIEPEQENVKRLILHFEAPDPDDPSNLLVDFDRIAFRHADSGYEEG